MILSVLELPARYAQPERAIADCELLLRERPADVCLLPEAALTGYVSPRGDFDLTRFAEPEDGPLARRLAALARAHQCHVVGPLVLAEGDRRYNAMAHFDREGELRALYRKRHPWFPEEWATPGPEPHPVWEIEGVKFTIAICFDVHFLAREARGPLGAADVLLFPSAWVDEEGDARAALLQGLAQRFDLLVANANWGPAEIVIPGQGLSRFVTAASERVIPPGPAGAARRLDHCLAQNA